MMIMDPEWLGQPVFSVARYVWIWMHMLSDPTCVYGIPSASSLCIQAFYRDFEENPAIHDNTRRF